ncbi:phosphomannomutase [Roseobacter cerasinus]|uniref:Phosphomannomutase n=1 Tax=Roseobacter cerasinus TaxID=2602289 RepID=A0A640VYK3_9RHOB|nr:phosphomannomutase [Roseobacter cerasinus]GFE52470.1 phosphomannomutase [Roseobacter cerasinus]
MPLSFGTSGLRGRISDLTPAQITAHIQGFLTACGTGGVICVGRDLRPSSPRIAEDVIRAARAMGTRVIDCGALPTPALALAAEAAGGGAVMVTGSHIPADRNGLKFYTRAGEITKADEVAILTHLGQGADGPRGPLEQDAEANARYIARYVEAFGAQALQGQRIGLYAHSAVGRDALAAILAGLGAEVIELGRSESFIPVDTEAVAPEVRTQIEAWVAEHRLDALVSTDGDSDRPLLADETGRVIPGDILGQITAEALGAEVIVTPISSNSGVTQKAFKDVRQTRIGSPYVIAAMAGGGAVVGYEANGGFLLGFTAQGPAGGLAPLVTRDCTLPLLTVLYASREGGVAARVAQEPAVVTVADRLQEVEQSKSGPLLGAWQADPAARAGFLALLGKQETALDLTDGLRMTLAEGEVLHLRPSGNAPELRLYVESRDPISADQLLASALTGLRAALERHI